MTDGAFDEMWGDGETAAVRDAYADVASWLQDTPHEELMRRQDAAERIFRKLGITFAVYGEAAAEERIIPFDIVPRVISAAEWARLERGLRQRVVAINAFLADIYGQREILKAGILPDELILANPQFRLPMTRIIPPHNVWAHVCGTDLVRTGPDSFFVLEDNARTPLRAFPTCWKTARRCSACFRPCWHGTASAPWSNIPICCWRCCGPLRRRVRGAIRAAW